MQETYSKHIEYEFNVNDSTAKVIRSLKANGDLKIPKSVQYQDQFYIITEINDKSFQCNYHIYSLSFSDDSAISKIGEFAFAYTSLNHITIPSSVKSIGKSAFTGCRKLKTLKFSPNYQLEKVSQKAFCKISIEKIILPSQVTTIEEQAFSECSKLRIIDLTNCTCLKTIAKSAFSMTPIETIFIPGTVEQIGERAFYQCKKLMMIDLSQNTQLKKIEKETFSECSLSFISISSSVEQIDCCAFSNCDKLVTIEIPQNSELRSIGEKAFYCASSLSSLYLPKKFAELGPNWRTGARNLKQITVSEENVNFCLHNQVLIGKSNEKSDKFDTIYFAWRSVEIVEIPCFIERIREYSFFRCNSIKSLNFESNSNLRIIEDWSFCRICQLLYLPKLKKLATVHLNMLRLESLICRNAQNWRR